MAAEVDFAGVLSTAVSDCRVATPARAFSALEGFLQWFATLAVIDKEDSLVMLRGDVDRIWHAALIHTAVYRSLCNDYVGWFVDHYPSEATPHPDWVARTVDRIEQEFGDGMHQEFRRWRRQAIRAGAKKVAGG